MKAFSEMWESFLDALVKASAMCDPVAYMYYLDAERETARKAAFTPYCERVHTHDDQWVALRERTCLWRDHEEGGAGPTIRGDARMTSPNRRPVLLSSRVRSGHDAC
jgi:hypothetical protein